jgi:hypothetical protein
MHIGMSGNGKRVSHKTKAEISTTPSMRNTSTYVVLKPWAASGPALEGLCECKTARDRIGAYLRAVEKRPMPPMINAAPTTSNCLKDSTVNGSLLLSSTGTVKPAMMATIR